MSDVTELADYVEEAHTAETTEKEEEIKKDSYVAMQGTGFKDFMLKPELYRAIADRGFEHPSEVQSQAIPTAIMHSDLLCQAKSGMGKTAVFVIAIIQQLNLDEIKIHKGIVSLVITHTRELAVQVTREFEHFLKYFPSVTVKAIYGGEGSTSAEEQAAEIKKDRPSILVGTPGRLMDLIERYGLDLAHLKHFVVDECDHVLGSKGDTVDRMREQVQKIFFATPKEKQVMMLSATLNDETKKLCRRFMRNPLEILIEGSKLTLHGLRQYHIEVAEKDKNRRLCDLIDSLDFNQLIIFTKDASRTKALSDLLRKANFPCDYTHGQLSVDKRIEVYQKFKRGELRIMVCNDLFARGIDIERVNIVINYDMPETAHTYLHRVGRAGRFGTKGLAISFVSSEEDGKVLNEVQSTFEVAIPELPDELDPSTYMGK